MKRSEMVDHIKADLYDMLQSIKNRPKAEAYILFEYAENILDMAEGFGMYPPPSLDKNSNLYLLQWEPELEKN